MTEQDIIDVCCGDLYENFALQVAQRVVDADAFATLFAVHIRAGQYVLTKPMRDKLLFRSSYLLETIYMQNQSLFEPYRELFFEQFPTIINRSAHRHYGKIAFYVIAEGYVPANVEQVAEACARWVTDERSRVAVKIWAVEVLLALRRQVDWIDNILEDLFESIANNPTPALNSRIKRWRAIVSRSQK